MYISTCNWQSTNAAFMGVSCCDMSWYVRLSIAWWKRITYKTYWPVISFKLIPVLLIKNDQNQSHFALPLISWYILISFYESSKYDNTWKRNQRSNFSSTFTKKGGSNRDTDTLLNGWGWIPFWAQHTMGSRGEWNEGMNPKLSQTIIIRRRVCPVLQLLMILGTGFQLPKFF